MEGDRLKPVLQAEGQAEGWTAGFVVQPSGYPCPIQGGYRVAMCGRYSLTLKGVKIENELDEVAIELKRFKPRCKCCPGQGGSGDPASRTATAAWRRCGGD